MSKKPFISTRLFVPDTWVDEVTIKTQLTIYPKVRHGDEPRDPIPVYDMDSYPGYIGVPISWGMKVYGNREEVEDRTVLGRAFDPPERPDPNHPSVREPDAQARFMDEMLDANVDHYSSLGVAPPGTGKTVVGLNTAAELGRSTLVIVPLQRLAKQWIETAVNVLGMKRSEIGIVQGPKCQYDKKLCIGIINSVAKKEYDPEFYHAFGTVIWDELHKYGSQMFSNSIAMFPARYKIGLTATPEARKDGTAPVYMTYFGGNQVTSEATSVPAKVHVMRYKKTGRIFGDDDRNLMLRCLQSDHVRNDVLTRIMCQLYDHGRNILGIGHSVDHIEYLIECLVEAGVPRGDIGQFTAEHNLEDGTRKKTSDEYLDWCKETPAILLATTQMMTLGVDVPRLDAGLELTPRTDGIQPLGRVRRPYPDKEMALWYSLVDTRFGMLQGYYKARKKEWREDPQIKVIEHA